MTASTSVRTVAWKRLTSWSSPTVTEISMICFVVKCSLRFAQTSSVIGWNHVDVRAYTMIASSAGVNIPGGSGSSSRCAICTSVKPDARPSTKWVGVQ